ncbi:MAG: DUF3147 family protein [Patescibacteria group bacterium]
MDTIFILKLILAFIVGGVWVIITTILAEKYGSKIGGWIGGLPSTSLLSLFFIGLTQSPQIAAEATTVMPAANGGIAIFALIFVFFIKTKKLFFSLAGAILAWFIVSGLVIYFNLNNFLLSIFIFLIVFIFSFYMMEKILKIKSVQNIKIKYNIWQIIGRGIFGGFIIGLAVLMGKLGGPGYGGVFASFPAMFISILIIVYKMHGVEFTRAIAKSFTVSALINVTAYAIFVRYAYSYIDNLYLGTLVAMLLALLSAYFTFIIVKKFTT